MKEVPLRLHFPRWSQALVEWSSRSPKVVISCCIVLAFLSAISLRRVAIDSDFLGLLPDHQAETRIFRETLAQFGASDMLLIGLKRTEEGDLENDLAFVEILAEALKESDDIQWLIYRNKDFLNAGLELREFLTLFLSPQSLENFIQTFSSPKLEQAVSELALQARSPLVSGIKDVLLYDPLNFAPLVLKDLKGSSFLGRTFHPTGFLLDPEEGYLLVLAKPKGVAADLPFSKQLVEQITRRYETAVQVWQDEGYESPPPELRLGGGYPIAAAEGKLITFDLVSGIIGSGLAVIFLFWYVFRKPHSLLIVVLPLTLGLLATFGSIPYLTGTLNAATAAFGALLIGLSVDFIVVFYARFLEETRQTTDLASAMGAVGFHTYPSILLGAITTAATFFAFLISDFRGLAELGLLTGVGILLSVLIVGFFLPALISTLQGNISGISAPIRSFGMEYLVVISVRYPKRWLLLTLALTLGLFPLALKVSYNGDTTQMRAINNPGLVAQNELNQAFGSKLTPTLVRIDANSEADLLIRTKEVLAVLEVLRQKGTVANVDSLLGNFPDHTSQNQALKRLSEFNRTQAELEEEITQYLVREGLNPATVMPSIDPYLRALFLREPLSLAHLPNGPLGPLLERYFVQTTHGFSGLVYVYLPSLPGPSRIPDELVQGLKPFSGVSLTGPLVISQVLKKVVWNDARTAMAWGCLTVLLLLGAGLGHAKWGLAAFAPLVLGLVWTIGFMKLLGLDFNFMNLFVFTMLLGIGVDYGLHIVHRWLENPGDLAGLLGICKPVVIASLTTLFGFGSMVFSHYPALKNMGMVAILGTVSVTFLSLSFLPAWLTILHQAKPTAGKEPLHQPPKAN